MPSTAFFTTIYPGVEPFLGEFVDSLNRQTDGDFTLVVISDESPEGRKLIESSCERPLKVLATSGMSPAGNRRRGIEFCRQHFDKIIFGDCDDYFAPNRVKVAIDLLGDFDLVVNDIDLVDEDSTIIEPAYWTQRLASETEFDDRFLIDRNLAGFTNTALRASALPKDLKVPDSTVAVDWYYFYRSLQGGNRGVFTRKTSTSYRQHGANTIGLGDLNKERIERSLEVKLAHYESLIEQDKTLELIVGSRINFLKNLRDNSVALRQYIEAMCRSTITHCMWWEEIQIPQDQL